MSFIRKNGETAPIYKEMFGGPGEAEMHRILLGADEMGGKGRLFNHIVLHPGCGFGWHVHDSDSETYYILRGEGEYSDNGSIVTLHAGDTAFCPDAEGHSMANRGAEPLVLMALVIYK